MYRRLKKIDKILDEISCHCECAMEYHDTESIESIKKLIAEAQYEIDSIISHLKINKN